MKNYSPLQNFIHLRLIVALASLCLSLLAIKIDDLINVDGVMYLNMAEAFVTGGLTSASQLYDWPFFSILIGLLSEYSWLDLETSALVINAILFVILTDGLLLVSNEGLRSLPSTAIAGAVIICFYTLNEYRDFIIRDVGYWAMTILALLQFLKFFDDRQTKRLIYWLILSCIGVMFRIEGIILLTLMPLMILLSTHKKKYYFVSLAYLPLVLLSALLVVVMTNDANLWGAFSKLSEYQRYFQLEQLMGNFWQDEAIIANQVINPIAKDQAGILLMSGLIGLVLHDIVTGLSLSLLLLYAMASRAENHSSKSYRQVITGFLLINLLILFSFTFSKQFITTRYCILAILAIMLLMMPKIVMYVQTAITQRNYLKISFILLLLSLSLVDTFHTTSSKKYITDAIAWTAHNSDKNSSIFTNDEHVAFYLAHKYEHINVSLHKKRLNLCTYDFAVIVEKNVSARISKSIKMCDWQLYKRFDDGRRSVKIYRSQVSDDN